MPKNPYKRRCKVPGCRAWARRGHDLCAAHARAKDAHRRDDLFQSLLEVLARTAEGPLDDVTVIEGELRNLVRAREAFMRWLQEQRDIGDAGGSAAQFLRAWNDSTSRVVQLLRARRDLGGDEDAFAPLIREFYDSVDEIVADRAAGRSPDAPTDEDYFPGKGPSE